MTQPDIHITIFKKTLQAAYPEHIAVKRNSTNECAHLYFDHGNLNKLVYTPSSTQGTKGATLKKEPVIYQFQQGVFRPLPPFSESDKPHGAFFVLAWSSIAQKRSILFFDKDLNVAASIYTDLEGKCLPDGQYIRNQLATVEEKTTSPSPDLTLKELQQRD